MKNKSSNKFLLTLITAVVLLGTLAMTLQASKRNVNPKISANSPDLLATACSAIPAGTYAVTVKTFSGVPWSVSCSGKNGKWSGTVPAGEFPAGQQKIPRISSGNSYSFNTTLMKVCDSGLSASSWKQICQTCKYIDCAKVKIAGSGTASQIQCSPKTGGYTATGVGKLTVSYNGEDLGSCSTKASYNGKITGSFTKVK